jgi:hypothetical protein
MDLPVFAAIEDAVLNASVATVKLNTYADSGTTAEFC